MGRGIARKFETTKKCSCDDPQWFADDIEINGNTKEITYILTCRNCKAIWKTKSHDARRYWADRLDKVPIIWNYYSYKGNKTVKELFTSLDMDRLEYLETEQKFAENKLIEAQKEVEKKRKAVEKFKKQLEELDQ